jgi:glucan phosphoethanolaminetransferase (alkaline phosphatase superfamily)
MKIYFSPDYFHIFAQRFSELRWRLLLWSLLFISLFALVQTQINSNTPKELLWLAFFILFTSFQLLVFSAFIFFFLKLPSRKEKNKRRSEATSQSKYWYKLYRTVEWCEAVLFFILLPLPTLIFFYALMIIS